MQLRILPLGASITAGLRSTTGDGYRKELQDRLVNDGNEVTYVGTQFHGTMTENACEAYSGYTIERLDNATLISGALDFLPNVILLNIGTNNCGLKAKDSSAAPAQYRTLLDHIKTRDADALVVVSSLLPNLNAKVNTCVQNLNVATRRVAREAASRGQRIAIVDMYDAVPTSDINGTHPNDDGYSRMAEVWYNGIIAAARNISAPESGGRAPLKSPGPRGAASISKPSILVISSVLAGVFVAAVLA
ncbi:hypothetical protein B0A48_16944 [Cryoendolithus antarcticus]|uniref:SGNH hydrolase-type esterase domain-containing protein n=1 Tax=Cryoendolithus antarcticus TaxID=1507870 RepID=A0A1V8SDF3_9PEZI|nr:hypothetical protein B0A48_16944 [Cryoendolithus antarcticus]